MTKIGPFWILDLMAVFVISFIVSVWLDGIVTEVRRALGRRASRKQLAAVAAANSAPPNPVPIGVDSATEPTGCLPSDWEALRDMALRWGYQPLDASRLAARASLRSERTLEERLRRAMHDGGEEGS